MSFALGLLDALRALAQRHRHVLDAGIAQVERMGVALAAIADDGDLAALDQIDVGVAIVVNAHDLLSSFGRRNRPHPILEYPRVLLGRLPGRDKPRPQAALATRRLTLMSFVRLRT